ncbi:MAG: hypothetical protein ACFFDI_28560 [Promethearchaeota archaeon]
MVDYRFLLRINANTIIATTINAMDAAKGNADVPGLSVGVGVGAKVGVGVSVGVGVGEGLGEGDGAGIAMLLA